MNSSSFSSSSNMSSKRSGGIRRKKSNARRTLDTTSTSNTSTTSYNTTKETTNNNDSNDEPDASNMKKTLTLLLEMNIDMSKQLNEVSGKLDNLVMLRKEQQKEKENQRQQQQQQLNDEKKKLLEKVNEIGKSFEKNIMESFELRMNCLESKLDKILKDLHHSSKEGCDDGVAGVTLSNDSSSTKETNSTIASCSTLDDVNSDREDERQRASSSRVTAAEECHDEKDNDDEMQHFVTSRDSLSSITPQEKEQEKEKSSSICVVSTVSKKQGKKKRRKNLILDCYQIDDGDINYCIGTKKRQRKVSVSKEDEAHQVQAYSNNKTHITNNEKEILLPLQPTTPEDMEWERQLGTYLEYTKNNNINMMMVNDENAVKKNASTIEAWATNQIYSFQNYIQMDESESEGSKDCNSNTNTLNEYRAERLRELRLFLPDTIENCYRSTSKRNRKEENNNTCHQHPNKDNIQNRQHCHQDKETHERNKVVITTTTTPSPVMIPQKLTISSSNTTSTTTTSKQSKHLHHHQEKETHERSKVITTTTTTTPSPVMMPPQQTTTSSSNTTSTSSTSKQSKKQQDHNNSLWNSHFTDMVNYIQNMKDNENENEDEFILVLDETKMGSKLYRWIGKQRSLWKRKKLIKYPDRIEKLSNVKEFMEFCDVDTNIKDNDNDEVPHSREKQNEENTTNNTTHATTSTSTSKQSKHLHHHQEKETYERSKVITTTTTTTTTPSPVMMPLQQTTISSSNTTTTTTTVKSTKRSMEEYQNERNSIWNSHFTDMVNYIQNMKNNEDENILVLNKTKMGSTLYGWILRQRSDWKKKLIKQQDRIEKLSKVKEFIEFCNDTNINDGLPRYTEKQNEAWQGRFEELSDFYNIHGHSNYIHSKDNHDNTNGEKNCNKIIKSKTPLADWIRRQRKTYSEGKLERSRIYRLESINFEWTLEDEKAAVKRRERGETSNGEESDDDGEDPMYRPISCEKEVSEEERIRQQQQEEEEEYNNMTEDEKREIYEYNEFLRNQAFDEDEHTE